MGDQKRVYFGQLLGMADHLTFTLARHGYKAYKYVPYGPIDEVVPYLIRRTQENSAILGSPGVQEERAMIGRSCSGASGSSEEEDGAEGAIGARITLELDILERLA